MAAKLNQRKMENSESLNATYYKLISNSTLLIHAEKLANFQRMPKSDAVLTY